MLYVQVQQSMAPQQLHFPWPMGSPVALTPRHSAISHLSLKRSLAWYPLRLEAVSNGPPLSDRQQVSQSGEQSDDACIAPVLLTTGSQLAASSHPVMASLRTLQLWHRQPSASVALISDVRCHITVRCAPKGCSCVVMQHTHICTLHKREDCKLQA